MLSLVPCTCDPLLYCNRKSGAGECPWIEPRRVLMDKIAFVTVGSTQFDALVDAVLGSEVIEVLQVYKFTRLVIQAGKSRIHLENATNEGTGTEMWSVNVKGLDAQIWRFKPSLETDFRSADLVICHAGEFTGNWKRLCTIS
jgi:hypothetical protein